MLEGAVIAWRVTLPGETGATWRRASLSAELPDVTASDARDLAADGPFEDGEELDRNPTVADLIAVLRRWHEEGIAYAAFTTTTDRLELRALITDWSKYRLARIALLCATYAAARAGAAAELAILGTIDGEYPVFFASTAGGAAHTWTDDPQNIGETGYREHIGDLEGFERDQRKWARKHARAR